QRQHVYGDAPRGVGGSRVKSWEQFGPALRYNGGETNSMKRILLNVICVTLLVIAGAGILLWARSLVTSEGLFVAHNFHRYALVSGDAAVIYTSGSYQFET